MPNLCVRSESAANMLMGSPGLGAGLQLDKTSLDLDRVKRHGIWHKRYIDKILATEFSSTNYCELCLFPFKEQWVYSDLALSSSNLHRLEEIYQELTVFFYHSLISKVIS